MSLIGLEEIDSGGKPAQAEFLSNRLNHFATRNVISYVVFSLKIYFEML